MRPGEFASTEIALALVDTRNRITGRVGTYRLLRDRQPTVWRAFRAGHVPQEAAELIAGTVRRLTKDESVALLDKLVVDVAACTAPPLLERWLQEFVTRSEPEQQDERTRRKLADRRVRVRPDVDGVSSLWASLSCLDAAAIDAVLTAIASTTAPGDPRTKQQRRADALVDLLLGRVSNGCHVTWIPTEPTPEARRRRTECAESEASAADTDAPSPDTEATSSDTDVDPWELTPADHRPTPTADFPEPAVSLPIECLTVIHDPAPIEPAPDTGFTAIGTHRRRHITGHQEFRRHHTARRDRHRNIRGHRHTRGRRSGADGAGTRHRVTGTGIHRRRPAPTDTDRPPTIRRRPSHRRTPPRRHPRPTAGSRAGDPPRPKDCHHPHSRSPASASATAPAPTAQNSAPS